MYDEQEDTFIRPNSTPGNISSQISGSFQVGIGNVWRFPYLAYQNGGSAILVPYVILLIFVGKPLYYMETAMGQFARTSPVLIWRCAPIMQVRVYPTKTFPIGSSEIRF